MKVVKNAIDATSSSYLLAYKCLIEKHQEFYLSSDYHISFSAYVFPAVTLAALSCEIALKNLIYLETNKLQRGHNLKTLFNKLSNVARMKYKDKTIDLYNMKSQELNSSIITSEDFNRLLDDSVDAYVKSRYFYEGNLQSVDLDFIEALMFSLNNAAEDYVNFVQREVILNNVVAANRKIQKKPEEG